MQVSVVRRAPRLVLLFSPRRPRVPPSSSPSRTSWAGQMGLRSRPARRGQFFPEINRIRTPLYHFGNCFQYLVSVNTNFLDRLDRCNLLQLKVANVFSIPLPAGCYSTSRDSVRSAFMFMHLGGLSPRERRGPAEVFLCEYLERSAEFKGDREFDLDS